MANYTKGEWFYYPFLSQFRIDVKGTLEPICLNIPKEANARLMAAAKEMYEALKHLIDYHNAPDVTQRLEAFRKAEEAIAKAEGRE